MKKKKFRCENVFFQMKCIPKKDMIRVVVNKEAEIFADVTERNKAVAHMFLKMLLWLKKHNKKKF